LVILIPSYVAPIEVVFDIVKFCGEASYLVVMFLVGWLG